MHGIQLVTTKSQYATVTDYVFEVILLGVTDGILNSGVNNCFYIVSVRRNKAYSSTRPPRYITRAHPRCLIALSSRSRPKDGRSLHLARVD